MDETIEDTYQDRLERENARLRAEKAEYRKDAARYQWLRSVNCPWPGVFQHEGHDDYGWNAIDGQDLDAAIDAALAASPSRTQCSTALPPRHED